MTPEEIDRLLEKYWAGDSSLEEELALKSYFSEDSIPEELRRYQPLFLWKAKQLQQKGPRIAEPELKKSVRISWYSFLKTAAAVLLALTLGIGFYTRYQQEKQLDRIFSETYSNPEDALRETKNVIGKISSVLHLAKDKHVEMQKLDSLEQIEKNNTRE